MGQVEVKVLKKSALFSSVHGEAAWLHIPSRSPHHRQTKLPYPVDPLGRVVNSTPVQVRDSILEIPKDPEDVVRIAPAIGHPGPVIARAAVHEADERIPSVFSVKATRSRCFVSYQSSLVSRNPDQTNARSPKDNFGRRKIAILEWKEGTSSILLQE